MSGNNSPGARIGIGSGEREREREEQTSSTPTDSEEEHTDRQQDTRTHTVHTHTERERERDYEPTVQREKISHLSDLDAQALVAHAALVATEEGVSTATEAR